MSIGHVVVGDWGIGETQRALLASRITAGRSLTVSFATKDGLPRGDRWNVKPDIGSALAAKQHLLLDPQGKGLVMFLMGHCILQGHLEDLFKSPGDNFIQTGVDRRLGQMDYFLLRYDASDRTEAVAALRELTEPGYDAVSECEVEAALLPNPWIPSAYWARQDAAILDCLHHGARPWWAASAPAADLWIGQLEKAIETGAVELDVVDQDISKGLARPSLRFQLTHHFNHALDLPATILDLDRFFVVPDLVCDTAQRTMLATTQFEFPQRHTSRLIFKNKAKIRTKPKARSKSSPLALHALNARYYVRSSVRFLRWGLKVALWGIGNPITFCKKLWAFLFSRS